MPHSLITSHLPQELIDHIVDHLYDDPLSLNSCSLVSRAWLPTSRLHLFSKVSLIPSNNLRAPADLCKRLHRLLSSSPSIIPNIHELEVCEGSPGLQQAQAGPHTSNSTAIRSTSWVTTERTFPLLLKIFTHLRRLEFSAQTTLHWATLPLTLQHALCHVFALPSLTYVRLKSWSFTSFGDLANLLAYCLNLKGLALSSTRVCNHSGDLHIPPGVVYAALTDIQDASDGSLATAEDVAPAPRRCGLEFLTLDYVDFGYLGYWLLSQQSTVDLKRLRELRVAHFHDVTAIERLLVATGSSLEHFHLKPGPWDGLRSIRLTLEDPQHALPWVKTLIRSILPSNVLERIGVEFYADLKQMVEGWAELDTLLLRPELSSLRQVDIGLFAPPSHAEFIRVKEELAGLNARGVLRVYQLGVKSQRSSRQLMPRISRYENN